MSTPIDNWVTWNPVPEFTMGTAPSQIYVYTPKCLQSLWSQIKILLNYDCDQMWGLFSSTGGFFPNAESDSVKHLIMDDYYTYNSLSLGGVAGSPADNSTFGTGGFKSATQISDFATNFDYVNGSWETTSDTFPSNYVLDDVYALIYSFNASPASYPNLQLPGNYAVINDLQSLFYWMFPECSPTPPTPTVENTASFSFPQNVPSGIDPTTFRNWSMAPLKTRIPFQNYGFPISVPFKGK